MNLTLKNTDAFLLHLSRHLSTTAGLEATLATTLFALTLLHTAALQIPASLRSSSFRTLPIFRTALLNLARTSDDVLMFLRLFGTLEIYTWARHRWLQPPHDPIIKLLAWFQIATAGTFQVVENLAFLAKHRILPGRHWEGRVPGLIALGSKFWFIRQGLEVVRLLRVRQLKWNEDFGAERKLTAASDGDAVVSIESEELKKKWRREVWSNLAWLPIRLYASYEDRPEERPVSDFAFGVCGVVPSWVMLKDAWRESA